MKMAGAGSTRGGSAHRKRCVDLAHLARSVLQLQTADKLRVAAMLLDKGCPSLAATIGRRAVDEIELAKLLGTQAVRDKP